MTGEHDEPPATSEAPRHPTGWTRLADDLRVVLPAWIAARLLVALAFPLADAVRSHAGHRAPATPRQQGLLFWDGVFYRDIAEMGYGAVDGEPLRFFPLFPLLGRLLSPLTGGDVGVALVVVANVAAVVAAVLLRRLALFEGRPPAVADRAAWLVLLAPPAFVLAFAYSEAIFLVLAIGCFLALRQGRWALAGLAAAAAAATRPVGLFLAVPVAVQAWQHRQALWAAGGPRRAAVLGALVAPALGTLSYLVYAGVRHGTWTGPYGIQEDFRGNTVDPVTRLVRGVGDLLGDERFGDGLHVPFAFGAVVLLVVCARRWPAPYTAFAVVLVAVALAADNLNSLERYLLATFPLVLALADVTGRPRVEQLTLAVCGSGLLALTTLALLGVYVP